jgi:hypothetical protein
MLHCATELHSSPGEFLESSEGETNTNSAGSSEVLARRESKDIISVAGGEK